MKGDDNKKYSKHARIRSRRSAVQAYYQWIMNQQHISIIINEFKLERSELKKADIDYFDMLLTGMVNTRENINAELADFLDRPKEELDPIEDAVLHLGSYELMYQQDIPFRVVINESIELAKMFGAEQSHKYINGVLDKVARKYRISEYTL